MHCSSLAIDAELCDAARRVYKASSASVYCEPLAASDFLPKVTTAATATRSAKKGFDHHRSYGYAYLILGHYSVRRLSG